MRGSEQQRDRARDLSGRTEEEAEEEERRTGSKPGWDDRSADL